MKSLRFQSSRRRAFILGALMATVVPLHASGQEATFGRPGVTHGALNG